MLAPLLINLFGKCGKSKKLTQEVLNVTFHPPLACNPYVARFLPWFTTFPTPVMSNPELLKPIVEDGRGCGKPLDHWPQVFILDIIWLAFNLEILVVNATLANILLQTGFTYD